MYARHFLGSCIIALAEGPEPLVEVTDAELEVCERWLKEGRELMAEVQASESHNIYKVEGSKYPIIVPGEVWLAFEAARNRTNTPEWAGPENHLRRLREVLSVKTILRFMQAIVADGALR
ncbi:hypothetical protein KIPB_007920 [Kipferlia bialata]|uniref:Uncharacterized protein n=1 Tax=Kipferlia bialata TaxID=797122 RepID=A0A9K3GKE6_9EUKA|nr:hypothetical protein KIPB_007920 [Kipferlia bialata]|eukprot:g7920.t1